MVRDRRRPVWMIYDDHMITGDECGPGFLAFVLHLRENPGKNHNQETDPTGDRTRTRCVRNNDVTHRRRQWSARIQNTQEICK